MDTTYNTLAEVPEPIREFYFEETVQELTGNQVSETYMVDEYNEQGEPTGTQVERTRMVDEYAPVTYVRLEAMPERKTIDELERLVGLQKPRLLVQAQLVANDLRWAFFDTFNAWLEECTAIDLRNEEITNGRVDIPELEGYVEPLQTKPAEPTKPESWPTADEVFAPYKRDLFKLDRTKKVRELTVEVDGMVFDGDEESQTRMARAILSLEPGEKMEIWVLADNSIVQPTREQLQQAMKLAGSRQSTIWTMP